jgi:glycosyltransferase involved in cell wall biosynthesis
MAPLKICYLLESTHLSGGVRVVFDQVRALRARGHEVHVRARFGDHRWYPYPVKVDYVTDLAHPADDRELDVAIGTFWKTVEPAMRLPSRLTVHLCQGCEFDCPEFLPFKKEIETVYRYPVLKLTVGEWLCDRLRSHFDNHLLPMACIGQIVDTDMYRPSGRASRLERPLCEGRARILIVGMYQSISKGISVALDAVEKVRRAGFRLHLTRVSPLPLSDAEHGHTAIDTYHERVSPGKMSEIYGAADMVLIPSTGAEGFGLPFAEALASGVPTVASRIPSFLSLDETPDYAYFVPVGDASAMAEGVRRLVLDAELYRHLSCRGPQVVRGRFSAAGVAEKLETYLQGMLGGQGTCTPVTAEGERNVEHRTRKTGSGERGAGNGEPLNL